MIELLISSRYTPLSTIDIIMMKTTGTMGTNMACIE
jgi:hypothetical protein